MVLVSWCTAGRASALTTWPLACKGCAGVASDLPEPDDEASTLLLEISVPGGVASGEQVQAVHDGRRYLAVVPEGVAEGSRLQLEVPAPAKPRFECEFACGTDGLGLALATCKRGLVVRAYVPLLNGAHGPAVHTGDHLTCACARTDARLAFRSRDMVSPS